MEIYVVQPGDSVDSIARTYGVSTDSIIYDNQMIPPYSLAIGQALLIDTGTLADNNTSYRPPLITNGYAYTFISPWVLEQTLPFLHSLSIFSYGFTSQGYLIYPPLDDNWMIQEAYNYDVRPILTLTPLDASGQFNNSLISALIHSSEAINTILDELQFVMETKGYTGVDIDFEYILAEDRDLFTAFVNDVADRFQPQGYTVSVAFAPKTSAGQQGLLYAGKDYPALGAIADYVLLMTYEWGYTYGPTDGGRTAEQGPAEVAGLRGH